MGWVVVYKLGKKNSLYVIRQQAYIVLGICHIIRIESSNIDSRNFRSGLGCFLMADNVNNGDVIKSDIAEIVDNGPLVNALFLHMAEYYTGVCVSDIRRDNVELRVNKSI